MSTKEKTIVVGIDGSDHSMEALRWAAEEAKLRECSLHIVQAWSAMLGVGSSPAGAMPPAVWSSEDHRVETAREMERTVDSALGQDHGVELEIVAHQGNPADILISAAERTDAELLVVGSRGRGGFKRLLLGSVGEQCATHAHCPVVIIRPVT